MNPSICSQIVFHLFNGADAFVVILLLSVHLEEYSSKYPNEIVFNLFPEPIDTMDIVNLFPKLINNVSFLDNKIVYNFTTQYHNSGYISTKDTVLSEIKELINEISGK